MTPTEPVMAISTTDCPKLIFVTSDGFPRASSAVEVDREALSDPRERAICRALLLHALALLDASEPANPNGRAQ